MVKVVICESKGKIEEIGKILGSGFIVTFTGGHILDLSEGRLSVDIKAGFEPQYEPIARQQIIISKLKGIIKGAEMIYLATDKDREGEYIAWSLVQVFGIKKGKRIISNSITKSGILTAMKEAGIIDNKLVEAQKARRILDRIVGYELSPLLTRHLKKEGLSAGRVQSVVARLIVDKENEIERFFGSDIDCYFKFKGVMMTDKESEKMTSGLYSRKTGNMAKISGTEDDAHELMKMCIKSILKVESVTETKRQQGPAAPFTTSTMQQDAFKKLGMAGKECMKCAQVLYEVGLITYMRTDSVHLSTEAQDDIMKFILECYGIEYYRRVEYQSKGNTQEAHEAVRPTDINLRGIEAEGRIGWGEVKLYGLIWKRTIASQMTPAQFCGSKIGIAILENNDHYFQSTLEALVFPGFLLVYGKNIENLNGTKLLVGDLVKLIELNAKQEYDTPPHRYDYASLVKRLDPSDLNIGRPATYEPVVTKILNKGYIEIKDIVGVEKICIGLNWKVDEGEFKKNRDVIMLGAEKGRYVPTILGKIVVDWLVINFPVIMDYQFTAAMEKKLDLVASGELERVKLLDEFYTQFHPQVASLSNMFLKTLGCHPDVMGVFFVVDGTKYGPSVKLVNGDYIKYAQIGTEYDVNKLTVDDAYKIMKNKTSANKKPLMIINAKNNDYKILDGPNGKYICVCDKEGMQKYTVSLPKGEKVQKLTLNRVLEIIDNKFKSKPR